MDLILHDWTTAEGWQASCDADASDELTLLKYDSSRKVCTFFCQATFKKSANLTFQGGFGLDVCPSHGSFND